MASLTGLIAGAVLATLFLATPADSTHEIDHRYLVVGYVQEGNGQAIPRTRVRLVREKTGLSHETMTGRDGFDLLIVHLHDDDVLFGSALIRLVVDPVKGDVIMVAAAMTSGQVSALVVLSGAAAGCSGSAAARAWRRPREA